MDIYLNGFPDELVDMIDAWIYILNVYMKLSKDNGQLYKMNTYEYITYTFFVK